jgi:hypothetical protein
MPTEYDTVTGEPVNDTIPTIPTTQDATVQLAYEPPPTPWGTIALGVGALLGLGAVAWEIEVHNRHRPPAGSGP